ncbi:MAG: hypothetical protein J0L84_09905 [Verrucomicrobia bacterium]|nr:hypothetical protein [Verrucomicrobiota bacterium]
MRLSVLAPALALVLDIGVRAAVPPAPQLFPSDTLLVLTVPDWSAARTSMESAPLGRLWSDPVMKPFRDKFEAGFQSNFLASLEKDVGLKSADWMPLLRGQVSLGVVKAAWNPADEDSDPTLVLVADARDQAGELTSRLTEVRSRLTEAKRTLRSEKIRDQEFTVVVIEPPAPETAPEDKAAEPDDEEEKPEPWEICFGQVDSALVVASSTAGLDRIVARLTGGSVPVLGEVPEFQVAETAGQFRESTVFGYLQAPLLLEAMLAGEPAAGGAGGAFGIAPAQLIGALGLDGLRSVSGAARQSDAGLQVGFLAAIPESRRTGVFRLLQFEGKEASPPSFVPVDAAEFQRMRFNGQQLWTGVEAMLKQISPQISAFLMMSVNALGKDRDPNFDFRKMFFGNLGDDWVSYEKAPRGKTLADLQNPPGITLLGAVNAEEMLAAVRALASLLPGGGADVKEREVNGKKILTLTMPVAEGQPARSLEIAASGGYVAFATDFAILEEFLRSADGNARSLRDIPGLAEAAQKVGGMSSGMFGYQNQRESAAGLWEALRTGGLEKVVPGMEGGPVENAAQWLDFSALPPFEQVSKYLGMQVSAGVWDAQGFHLRSFTPPPK